MNWVKLTIQRLKTDTPQYFKKLRSFCFWYSGAAAAMLTINTTFNLPTPEIVTTIIGYSIAGATFLGFGASLTTTDHELSQK